MTIYLNGDYMPIEEARVPVLDRGFIFGDGVYEVIPVYSRRAFRLAEHLKRLQHSLDGIKLKNPHSESEWTNHSQRASSSATHPKTSTSICTSRAASPSAIMPFPIRRCRRLCSY